MAVDHYQQLAVDSRASQAVIDAAYLALIEGLGSDEQEPYKAAFRVIGDPKKRAAYDKERLDLGGKVIGQYRLIEKIAEGGFGTTYKGEHVRLKVPVCIKHCPRISPAMDRVLEQEAKVVLRRLREKLQQIGGEDG